MPPHIQKCGVGCTFSHVILEKIPAGGVASVILKKLGQVQHCCGEDFLKNPNLSVDCPTAVNGIDAFAVEVEVNCVYGERISPSLQRIASTK
jgi:hypothetical protein